MAKQKLKLRFSADRRHLVYRRFNSNREPGEKKRWRIGEKSNLPRPLFFLILGFIRRSLSQYGDRDYGSLKKGVVRGLCQAAKACGCSVEFGEEGADVLWQLKDMPLIGFQIHRRKTDKERLETLLWGGAIFRWTIIVREGGYFRCEPCTTNTHVLTKATNG